MRPAFLVAQEARKVLTMSEPTNPSVHSQPVPLQTQHTLKMLRALYQLRVREIEHYTKTHPGDHPWWLTDDTVELGKTIRRIERGRI